VEVSSSAKTCETLAASQPNRSRDASREAGLLVKLPERGFRRRELGLDLDYQQ
jgi:hypothetical protein